MCRKTIFLDIDGTLMNFWGQLPESAEIALKKAKEKGHRLVLCTGRTKAEIYPKLLNMNFDGIIAAAGAYVECDGKEIYRHVVTPDKLARVVDCFENNGVIYTLQTGQGLVMTKESRERFFKHFLDAGLTEKQIYEVMVSDVTIENDPRIRTDVEKLAYYESAVLVEDIQKELGDYFRVEGASYGSDTVNNGEVTCSGETKATGMARYLSYAGEVRENTIGVGDGPNDMEMLAFTGFAVAMGNAKQQIKTIADYITSDVDQDGLYKAFQHLKLYE